MLDSRWVGCRLPVAMVTRISIEYIPSRCSILRHIYRYFHFTVIGHVSRVTVVILYG